MNAGPWRGSGRRGRTRAAFAGRHGEVADQIHRQAFDAAFARRHDHGCLVRGQKDLFRMVHQDGATIRVDLTRGERRLSPDGFEVGGFHARGAAQTGEGGSGREGLRDSRVRVGGERCKTENRKPKTETSPKAEFRNFPPRSRAMKHPRVRGRIGTACHGHNHRRSAKGSAFGFSRRGPRRGKRPGFFPAAARPRPKLPSPRIT